MQRALDKLTYEHKRCTDRVAYLAANPGDASADALDMLKGWVSDYGQAIALIRANMGNPGNGQAANNQSAP